jgi:hypothetical protein
MKREYFIEVKCAGERIALNLINIEALLPGTLRHFGPEQKEGPADWTIVRLVSGHEPVIDHPLDDVLRLIAKATKPEDEL